MALAQREHLRDHAEEVLRHVDREALDRLAEVNLAESDAAGEVVFDEFEVAEG